MASRYCSILATTFTSAMSEMGFLEIAVPGCEEIVFERVIHNGRAPNRYKVRIMSSVSRLDGITRDCGEDAIRVLLMSVADNRVHKKASVHRTRNALLNTRKRAWEMWAYVMARHHHCDCGSLMIERKGKNGSFLGCTSFPTCRSTRPLQVSQERAA